MEYYRPASSQNNVFPTDPFPGRYVPPKRGRRGQDRGREEGIAEKGREKEREREIQIEICGSKEAEQIF